MDGAKLVLPFFDITINPNVNGGVKARINGADK
jgi:hypothetical protein